jgi:hypothetical protein
MSTLTFDALTHTYAVGSRELPSVTKILRACSLYSSFYAKEEDRQRGEAVHHACRLICEGRYREEGTHARVIPYARAFQKFVSRSGYRHLGAERPMASLRLNFAGTPDLWGTAGDPSSSHIWLLDLKSGTLPQSVGIQLAAYKMLMADQPVQERVLVTQLRAINLSDDESYGVSAYDEPRWEAVWRSCLTVYQCRKDFNLLPKDQR